MILQALVKYYEDLERQEKLPKQGWCQAKVSYGINLSTDGDIKNILWLKEERQAGKKQIWISQTMKVPAMLTRSSGVVNKKIVNGKNFTKKENGAVLMDDELRKKLLVEWQKKKKETITHPFLKEKVEWGMVPYVQAMLLARYLRGDLDSYPVFLWK